MTMADHLISFPKLLMSCISLKAFRDQTESLSWCNKTRAQINRDQFDSIKGIGLKIVNALLKNDESSPNFPPKPTKSLLLLASNNLSIKIPRLLPLFSSGFSPVDFGVKTRRRNVVSPEKTVLSESSLSVTVSEMELSEDYTRVISYGPNPRTTQIFDDRVVENCCGIARFPTTMTAAAAADRREENKVGGGERLKMNINEKFLRFSCYHCRKNLQQGQDVYILRGEKAFCSHECRQIEIMLEEEEEEDYAKGNGEENAMDINTDLKLFFY